MDSYVEECRARGVGAQTVAVTAAWLDRLGRWLKHRRPRVAIERIHAQQITRYNRIEFVLKLPRLPRR